MTGILADADHRKAITTPTMWKPAEAGRRTLRILAAIDDTECTGLVIKYLLNLCSYREPIEVVLLNIQPEPQAWRMRGYTWFKREEIIDRLVNDLGKRALASAGRYLDGAEIRHEDRIELGHRGDIILRCAREAGCDLIVMAEAQPHFVQRWLLRAMGLSIGSVASIVAQCAQVPVVVAK